MLNIGIQVGLRKIYDFVAICEYKYSTGLPYYLLNCADFNGCMYMKKLRWFLLFLLVAGTLTIYLLIPKTIRITSVTTVHTTDNGTQRFLIDETKWSKWWHFTETHTGGDEKKIGQSF